MSKVLPVRVCPLCAEDFTPVPRRRDGSLPEACPGCIRAYHGRQRRGVLPAAFQAAAQRKRAQSAERAAGALRGTFGAITAREAAIYAWASARGYDRGYNAAYASRAREQRRSA